MHTEELAPEELSALLSSYMPDLPGYRVMRRIGRGGMSYVYLGVQVSLDRQVAIKVMAPEAMADEKSKQRFEQEARTIAKLEHPSIVGIHEVGRSPQGLMYYVLPYLAKGHLGQRDFTNDEARATEVLRSLLSALEYAHARGIVHRDVKAENVLFDNADRPLLTDFGIALAKRDTTRITTAGLAVGSGGYMAPEQARGEAVDGRADLYSVGVLAFELLTGHLPYLSGDQLGLALMHAQDPIPRLPPEKRHWQAFIDRAMAKSPDNRYRNAQQMLSALNLAAGKERPNPHPHPIPVAEASASVHGPYRAAPAPLPARRAIPTWLMIGVPAVALALAAFFALRPHTPAAAPKTDFFTSQDVPATTPTVASAAPNTNAAPTVDNAVTDTTPPLPAPAEPAPADTPTPTSMPAAEPATTAAAPFAMVSAQATVTPLDYDPTQPGAHQLSLAQRQLKLKRLGAPPGDNAADSLLAAHKAAPASADVAAMSDKLIAAFSGAIGDAIRAGRNDNAKSGYQRANKFAKQVGRDKGPAWLALRVTLAPMLMARLEKSALAMDYAAIAKTKALAAALELGQAELEPAWSHASVVPKLPSPGDLLPSDGPAMVLVTVPSETRNGLAVMREEVTRGQYASFVAATHRPAAKCGNALQAFFGSKHNWSDPGISQSNEHPVVCVSQTDARAFASWLNQRGGQHYRLPTALEWRAIVDYRGGDPCRSGRIACGSQHGTAAGSGFAPSPLGIQDLRGNVSEWLADNAGAGRNLVAGLSWRDPPTTSPLRTDGRNGDRGADDIGFRLVRDVTLKDVVTP